jgi:hypothetical protein
MANKWDDFHENMGDEQAALHMSGAFDSEVGHDHDPALPGRGAPIKSTVDQTLSGGANTGTLTQILSWIVRQIKLIINKPNWYDEVDSFSIFKSQINLIDPLGVPKPYFSTVLPEFYLWCDGKTIGDVLSGATARANADVHDLFVVLWRATGLAIYESTGVLSARGASAEADWVSHKRLKLPNMRDNFLRGPQEGREIGSYQGDAIRNITGNIVTSGENKELTGAFYPNGSGYNGATMGGEDTRAGFDASRVVPTADENRPKNISCNWILRY